MRLVWLMALWTAAPAWTPRVLAQPCGWRGDGSGCYPSADPPTQWNVDGKSGIRWQVKVGPGQSSPVAAGDKIYLTAEPQRLLCLELSTGRILWDRDNGYATLPPDTLKPARPPTAHRDCGYSTPTPVCDGRSVWAVFGNGIVVCCDIGGNRRWGRLIDEPLLTSYGRTASPVLAGDKLLVTLGTLTALDPNTGRTLWHADAKATYGTPAAFRLGATDMAITPQGDCVRLTDGKLLARRLGKMEYTSPLVYGGVVYFVGEPTVAFRLPERAAEPFAPSKLWECEDVEGSFYASPLVCDDMLYCVSNEGELFAVDAASGKLVYRKKLDDPAGASPAGEPVKFYGSPALAANRLFLTNDRGKSFVVAAGRQFANLARNYVDKGSGASPVPAGRFLLLRSGDTLYCIGGH